MYAHNAVCFAAVGPWREAASSNRLRVAALLVVFAAVLGGCSVAASNDARPHPADARVRVPAAAYRNVTSGYASQRPADPQSWRERNERVTPQENK